MAYWALLRCFWAMVLTNFWGPGIDEALPSKCLVPDVSEEPEPRQLESQNLVTEALCGLG